MFRWLTTLFRRTAPAAATVQAHLTFGATSVGRTISRTGLLLKKQIWIWPIIAVVLLASVGYGIRVAIERTMRANLQSQLETLLSVEQSMLESWLKVQEANAEALANDSQIRRTVLQILAASRPNAAAGSAALSDEQPVVTPEALQDDLAKELEAAMASHGFAGYIVTDKSQRIIAAYTRTLVGTTVLEYAPFLTRAIDGGPSVSTPFPSVVMLKDKSGRLRSGIPTMFVAAPVRDENLNIVAVLAMRIQPEREFTRILQLGRIGATGETYAIDKSGRLISNSRFDEELILLGLLPDTDDAHSILNITIRDPGGNMRVGYRPKVRRSELPLTEIAAAAASGKSGVLMDAYNDYRGSPCVGAYAWLPKYDMGLITEISQEEAFRPLAILRWAFFSMFALLVVASVAIFVFTLVVARLQRKAQMAEIEAKHLGQYRLEERIGAGAMGVVYKGHHAMLRRPTAIKMLNVDKVNDASIQRFEREVQITCQLNHPSTVAIYDYGRTPEGVFYYAMEFLDGIDLQVLVDRYGPQPEGRVIRILKAVCGSLYEAHSLGLVHRDIKPANIMLNRRGGESDVVKVLDFGLVKALDEAQQAWQSGGLAGTPLYMSPEAIQTPDSVDPRSDLYAVGAVGYFLLTGKPVFTAGSLVELCQQHVVVQPETPSTRLGREVSPELESALLACLEKNRAKRPQTARDLAALLDRAPTADSWSLEDGDAWWGKHERSQSTTATSAAAAAGGSPAASSAAPAASPAAANTPSAAGTTRAQLDQTMALDAGKDSP